MAKREMLNCLEKRDLLNQAVVSLETLSSWGRHYEEAGLAYDAVNFYEKAGDRDALARLLESAGRDGDIVLFSRICRILEREVTQEEWLSLSKSAEAAGKYAFAGEARRRGGVEESSERHENT